MGGVNGGLTPPAKDEMPPRMTRCVAIAAAGNSIAAADNSIAAAATGTATRTATGAAIAAAIATHVPPSGDEIDGGKTQRVVHVNKVEIARTIDIDPTVSRVQLCGRWRCAHGLRRSYCPS